MTEREVMQLKVDTFSTVECIDKLIEELEEALAEAVYLSAAYHREAPLPFVLADVSRLMEELADVEVAGKKTFFRLFSTAQWVFTRKVQHAIFDQIPAAIREKETDDSIADDGD